MNHHEEEWQLKAEQGELHERSADAEAYRQVFSVLKQEVPFTLPSSFADKLVERIMKEAAEKDARRDRWWLIGGVVLFFIGMAVSMALVKFPASVGVFTFFAGYPGLVLFGALFIGVLHLLDRKFIRTLS